MGISKGMTKIPAPYDPERTNKKFWIGWFIISTLLFVYAVMSLYQRNIGESSELHLLKGLVFGANLLICIIVGFNAKLK